ncbi:MAG: TolB family protein, partial [Gemmatimonadaceae bacterium]
LANIRQLTHGGENAEAYFSADGKRLIFQSTRDGRSCDQEYVMNADGSDQRRISDGTGKTTCGYFFAYDTKVFYASTRAADTACPKKPDPSKGYVWGLDRYDIYTSNPDGSDTQRLTNYGVYTAEGTLSPDGKTIVFTSLKDGDLEIYTMNVDGTGVHRLTHSVGYDGGPFFSPDGKRIVYRAYHPTDSTELAQYEDLLHQSIVRPNKMEIWVMNADGSDQHQITHLGGANFAPFFTPDEKKIIFSSNYRNPHSGEFDLYLVNDDGTGLEQVTTAAGFDGFPQFSPDGRQLVWASSRNATGEHQLDLFIADWRQR